MTSTSRLASIASLVVLLFPVMKASALLTDFDYDGRNDQQEYYDGTDFQNPFSVLPVRLGYWRMNTTFWSGEQGQVPWQQQNLLSVPSWNGSAVYSDSAAVPILRYRDVETNGNANINIREGTVRFWFRPHWNTGTGPGMWGRMLEMGSYTADASYGLWALHFSPDGSQIFFTTQASNVPVTPFILGINWAANQWHQLALTYGPAGCALYIDGQVKAAGASYMNTFPSLGVRQFTGFNIGNEYYGGQQAKGDFDEVETFNYRLGDAAIATNYQAVASIDTNGNGIPDELEDIHAASATPFAGTPFTVTCAIEAEQIDRGGEGVAYHDLTPTNSGGVYRGAGVDIAACTDAGGGYCVVSEQKGEWLKYSVNVAEAGLYTIETRVASVSNGGQYHIEFNGTNRTGTLAIPNTGGAQAWASVVKTGVALGAGQQSMRLVIDNGSANFNWITLYPTPTLISVPSTNNITVTAAPYNARGNGQDSAAPTNRLAFQSAITSLVAKGGGTLNVPAGTYVLDQASPNENADALNNYAVWIQGSRILIKGAGTGTVIKARNRSTTLFYFGSPYSGTYSNVGLSQMTLAGRPHTKPNGTYENGAINNGDWTIGSLVVFRGQTNHTWMRKISVMNCTFVNPSVNAVEFGDVDGALFVSNQITFFQGEAPYGTQPVTNDSTTATYPIDAVGIRSGAEPVKNVVAGYNSFNGNPALSASNHGYAADGFIWLTAGGNWMFGQNSISNNALEGIQCNAGPFAAVGNRFLTWATNQSSCAFNAAHAYGGTNIVSPASTYAYFSVVGNVVTGNITGCRFEPYATNFTARFDANISGNTWDLLETANTDGGVAILRNAGNVVLSGNVLKNGGKGAQWSSGGSAALVIGNDFSGAKEVSILTQDHGTLDRMMLVGNIFSAGWGTHIWADDLDSRYYLYSINNQFRDVNGVPVSPAIHVSDTQVDYYQY